MNYETKFDIEEKEKSLKEAYSKLLEVGFGDGSLEINSKFIDENVMGYGTALDEKIMSLSEFKSLIIVQRNQSTNFDEFSFISNPILTRFLDSGNTAFIVDEIELLTRIENESNKLSLRMTTIFEHKDNTWKVIHWHGSRPEHVSGGDDPYHVTEWKQKQAELEKLVEEKTLDLLSKNNELEIEAALERVRTIALSMNEPGDMLEVCKVISTQLELLGLKDIRNVQTAIINESNSTYLNFEYYRLHKKKLITEVDYSVHPKQVEFAKAMLKSSDSFIDVSFAGDELKEWIEHQRKTPQFIDSYLEDAESLNYYYHSIGPVALGMSTYSPLTEGGLKIFKRFRNVFELSYKRFIDIEKAIAQAREAKIEAALERVRAKAMAMQHSDELAETSFVLDQQVRALGIETWGCAFHIYADNAEGDYEWFSSENGNLPFYKTPREKFFLRFFEKGQSGEKFHIEEFVGEDCKAHYEYLMTLPVTGDALKELVASGIPLPTSQIDHVAYFKYGYILFVTFHPVPEAHDIFKRFAMVFEQTYTRFLDLQKSEEQRKIIQAENDRKTEELEEARKLQMAMLPKELPKLSKLDIAVYMQTATEVGGDYYDFSFKDNGSLNVCLGDATGHGLKAGTLVSMMKSLFVSESVKLEIDKFFISANETLKKMSLNKMMMAFAMINIYGTKIQIANAGIPPIFIFRKIKNIVEEVSLNGLPIGAMKNTKYEVYETELSVGDTILMLSDGFPELQNTNDEMYGYAKIKDIFSTNANCNSEEIISFLKKESKTWADKREPNDDITFVVIKLK